MILDPFFYDPSLPPWYYMLTSAILITINNNKSVFLFLTLLKVVENIFMKKCASIVGTESI